MIKKIFLLLIFTFTLFLQYCSAPVVKEEVKKSIPVNRILKRIEANRRKAKTFIGSGILKVESEKFSGKANFEIMIKKPDSLKLSIFGPFGLDVGELLLTDKDYYFYDAFHNKLYYGKDRQKVIEKIFQLNFEFDDLLDAFAGAVNLTDKLNAAPDDSREDENYYYFVYGSNQVNSTYQIDKENLTIKNYKLKRKNDKIIESSFSDFSQYDGLNVPAKINLKYFEMNANLDVNYRNIRVNKEISNMKLFVPDDAEKINL